MNAVYIIIAGRNIFVRHNNTFSRELRCFGLLRGEQWQFLTDVSGQPIGSRLRVGEGAGFKMGPIGYAETSVRNCHCSIRNYTEERSSQLLRGGSLKSRKTFGLRPRRIWGFTDVPCTIDSWSLLISRDICRLR